MSNEDRILTKLDTLQSCINTLKISTELNTQACETQATAFKEYKDRMAPVYDKYIGYKDRIQFVKDWGVTLGIPLALISTSIGIAWRLGFFK